ncbi:four-helix bundle copper-binding protein [Nafulsella turpanensis]|uniref:four-helix bundle copper-binding protein n=1 Tax=Nafulsella turpanensis TaxID=1265690 RepID=UPI000349F623|nr:four-helix bundle copper-binding protein [Nafulsella turpanensis]
MNNKQLLEKLAHCAAACENCADACLDEDNIKMMVKCIRLDRDCAKICMLTHSFVASNSPHAKHVAKECLEICRLCGEECSKMEADHCKECARACKECEDACKAFLA